jgi:hypothetical protein
MLSISAVFSAALTLAGASAVGARPTPAALSAGSSRITGPDRARQAQAALLVAIQGRGVVTSAPAAIDCGSDPAHTRCSADFSAGTAVVLTAAPAEGFTFWGWVGACTTTQPRCTVPVGSSNASVTAVFTGIDIVRANFSARWRKSNFLTGAAVFEGLASHAAEFQMVLRLPNGQRFGDQITLAPPGGRFSKTFTFRRLRGVYPGTGYGLTLIGTVLGKPYQRVFGLTGFPAPPEGVVRAAFISSAINFSPRRRFPSGTTGILAHFNFAALPRRGRQVTTTWYLNGRAIGRPARKPRARVVRTLIVVPGGRLPNGRYRCVIRAGRTIVQDTTARIG